MEPFIPREKRPEDKIRDAIVKQLELRGWFCKITNGNMYQSGLPDIYATHKEHGPKWIEVKRRDKDRLTGAQKRDFPRFSENGAPIWILTSVDELHLIFGRENWRDF